MKLLAIACKFFGRVSVGNGSRRYFGTVQRNGIFRRNLFPTRFIPTAPFGRLFCRKIIFPTEKVTFSVGNSVGKIRLFSSDRTLKSLALFISHSNSPSLLSYLYSPSPPTRALLLSPPPSSLALTFLSL